MIAKGKTWHCRSPTSMSQDVLSTYLYRNELICILLDSNMSFYKCWVGFSYHKCSESLYKRDDMKGSVDFSLHVSFHKSWHVLRNTSSCFCCSCHPCDLHFPDAITRSPSKSLVYSRFLCTWLCILTLASESVNSVKHSLCVLFFFCKALCASLWLAI